MGLFPRAPKVNIYAPSLMFVGKSNPIDIEIVASDETKVDFVDVRVQGKQGWSIGSGKSRVTQRVTFPELATRLMGAGALPAGTSRFTTRFTLPPGTPPSHAVDPGWAQLELHVHVSIPWWPDGRYRYTLPVRIPPPSNVARTPVALRSTRRDDSADEPRIEISLASARLVAGETLVGSCAVFHLDDRKPRDVDLSLVPALVLLGRGRRRDRRGTALGITLELPAGSAGTSVPFRLQLPHDLTPSFATVSHEVAWWLIAKSGSFFGKTVEVAVPLEIVDASAAASTERLVQAPRLADERVAAVFERFATAEGWHAAAQRADGEMHDHAIEIDADAIGLHVAYAYRGKDGTFLVARIAHRSLGLGLAVRRSSAIERILGGDVEIDVEAWDRSHVVHARSNAQAVPFLRATVPHVLAARLGDIASWTDDALTFERAVVAVENRDLADASRDLRRIAAAITTAAHGIAPPLPADVDGWRELARWLRGDLSPGDLSIDGELDGLPVDLGITFDDDGRPTQLRVALGDPERASAAAREIALACPLPAAGAPGAPDAVAELLHRWPTDFVDLRVADGVVAASWALPLSDTGGADAKRARELVSAARAVLGALDPGAGPYR